jgi:membrane protein DedA with SNARE-associated domain
MKGTIYLWILAAVLSGALVGLLGFAIGRVFNLQSSVMEPVIVSAIAGVVAVLITIALFRNGKAD